jgi:RND family efflux transporter MFP subunit
VAFERTKALNLANALAKKEYEDVERTLRLAEASYQGKVEARDLYVKAREDLSAILRQTGSTPGPASDAESPLRTTKVPLRAPLTGTLVAAQVAEGEYIDPARALFTVINLDRVWLESRVSEYDLERVVSAPAASFTLASHPGRSFPILGRGGQLIDVGSVVDPGSRTLPVRYQLENPERLLRVGMFADVAIETKRVEQAVAIPDAALVEEDARPTAYVLLDGEHYQKRDLELGIRDSGFVQVTKGVQLGERVVTRGAYAIRLASVSAVIPAHGHTH